MRIAVPAETDAGETRVAATPDTVKKFLALGATVSVGAGAGLASGIPDSEFEAAGATIADTPGVLLDGADIVLKVRRPTESELADYRPGAIVVALRSVVLDDRSAVDPAGEVAAGAAVANALQHPERAAPDGGTRLQHSLSVVRRAESR